MKRFWTDFAVGVFVIIGLLSLIFLTFRVGNVALGHADSTYTIKAEFDNIGGVRVGAPIKSSGYVIGSVKNIELDIKKYKSVMFLEIKSKYPFPKDSQVGIYTTGLLGEQYVSLSPGIEAEMFKNGDVASDTQSAIVIEKLIGQAMLSLTKKE